MGFLTHLIAFASGIVASFLILFLGITYFLAKKVAKSEVEDAPPIHLSTSAYGEGTQNQGDRSRDASNFKFNSTLSTIPESYSEENLKVGWMKLQHSFKVWGTRWFVLRPGLLLYYGSNKAKRVWGIVRLDGCKVIPITSKKGGFAFKIYHPDNKFIYSTKGLQGETIKSAYMPGGGSVMKLRILSEQDRDDWMKAVEIAASSAITKQNNNNNIANVGNSLSSSEISTIISSSELDTSQEQPPQQLVIHTTSSIVDTATATNQSINFASQTLSVTAFNSTPSMPNKISTNPLNINSSTINMNTVQPTPRSRAHTITTSTPPLLQTTNLPPPPNPNSGYSMEITAEMRNYYDGEVEIRNVSGKSWVRRWIVVRKGLLIIFNSEASSDCAAVIDLDGCDVRYWSEKRKNSTIRKQQQLMSEVNSEIQRQGLLQDGITSDGEDKYTTPEEHLTSVYPSLIQKPSPQKELESNANSTKPSTKHERSMSLDNLSFSPYDHHDNLAHTNPKSLIEVVDASERVKALDLQKASSLPGPAASLILDGVLFTVCEEDVKTKKKDEKKHKKHKKREKENRSSYIDMDGNNSSATNNEASVTPSSVSSSEIVAAHQQQKEDVLDKCFSDEEDKSLDVSTKTKRKESKKTKSETTGVNSTETKDQERVRKEAERKEKEIQKVLDKERKKKEKEEKKQKKSEKKESKTSSIIKDGEETTKEAEKQRKDLEKKEKELQRTIEKERRKKEKEEKKEIERQKKLMKRKKVMSSDSFSGVMSSASEDSFIPSLEVVENMISTAVERELRDLMSDHDSDNDSDKDVKEASYDSDGENDREMYAFEMYNTNRRPIFVNIPSFTGKKSERVDHNPLFDLTQDYLVMRSNNSDNMEWWMDVIRECSTPTSPNPASEFPILLPRYIDSVISHSGYETCHWFTTFMTRYFKEMQQSSAFGENVKRVITRIIDKLNLKRPKRLTPIMVDKVEIGDAFPDLKQIKMVSVPTKAGEELVGEVDVLYEGGASISLSTSVIISKFVTVPLIAYIQLQSLEGKMHVFGSQDMFSRISASFVALPKLEFGVQLSLGSAKYQLSSLFPSIKAFLINALKKVIWRHTVAPNKITFSLPLPEQKIRLKTEKLTSRRSRARREHERALLLSTGALLNSPYFTAT
eukprot:TRINITY_DN5830_c0_g3_i1.p1 TRINITY_DN5830_c0_g3~~TRINITY_DN5830_c0_g3_i1.p1  ORF type:complete len:1150 (+),score=295.24 TRINITY_DN5830_c0_g3_i1:110-3559(+)